MSLIVTALENGAYNTPTGVLYFRVRISGAGGGGAASVGGSLVSISGRAGTATYFGPYAANSGMGGNSNNAHEGSSVSDGETGSNGIMIAEAFPSNKADTAKQRGQRQAGTAVSEQGGDCASWIAVLRQPPCACVRECAWRLPVWRAVDREERGDDVTARCLFQQTR